ncbi:hypothetical protein ACXYMT_13100 [Salinimicrobium sp. CAU 1759]
MLTIENPQAIEVIKSFSDHFKNDINNILNGKNITIVTINEQHERFALVATTEDPFAANKLFQPAMVAINEQVCQQLELTQEEQYAMIAHEIGHVLDNSPRQENNYLEREYNADQFTINLGLSNELKAGLEKVVNSGNYSKERQDIEERIKRLA